MTDTLTNSKPPTGGPGGGSRRDEGEMGPSPAPILYQLASRGLAVLLGPGPEELPRRLAPEGVGG